MTEFTVKENSLTASELISLFQAVNWTPPCAEQAETALANSLVVFSVHCGEKTAAMARVTGDGAMSFYIKDAAVRPEFQHKGLGKLLMSLIDEYVSRHLQPGWAASVELMSAVGKEDFYKKCGFRPSISKGLGSGMIKMIRR